MTQHETDPRLTAFVLHELDPEERARVVAMLAADPAARAEVTSLARTHERVERALRGASGPSLSNERRARIFAALGSAALDSAPELAPPLPSAPRRANFRRLYRLAIPAAALVMALGALVFVMIPAPRQAMKALEQMDAPDQRPVSGLRESVEYGRLPDSSERLGRRVQMEAPSGAAEFGMVGHLASEVNHPGAAPSPVARGFEAIGSAPARESTAARDRAGSRESYDSIVDNPFIRVSTDPLSTFSIDVDTASYALVRRFLRQGQLPPAGAVRIEELINYFSYDYPEPQGDQPFSVVTDVAQAPWAPTHQLVRVGIKAKRMRAETRPAANLVFLVDVSGSMDEPDKLPLVQRGLRELTESLTARDRVAIVVYAGASGLVLPSTPAHHKAEIHSAIDRLSAGGSTNGGQGIELAYALAAEHFVKDGVNRVLLATDGDFNVGVTNQSDLVELIQRKAKTGVFLSVLGFGTGNYQDSTLEKLADKGNGNYAYIDDASEARKVLVEQATSTLVTVAKDVKLQIEFNPRTVSGYRLIGYENRVLAHQDFNDDNKDAGEVGAGHTVTALYEIIPPGVDMPGASVDALKYQAPRAEPPLAGAGPEPGRDEELLTVKLRYQRPEGSKSQLMEVALRGPNQRLQGDFRFAAAVAEFGMLLRNSPARAESSYAQVSKLADGALGSGPDRAARRQFVELVGRAEELRKAAQ